MDAQADPEMDLSMNPRALAEKFKLSQNAILEALREREITIDDLWRWRQETHLIRCLSSAMLYGHMTFLLLGGCQPGEW